MRSKNGLKVLSWKVKEIVENLRSGTYQEVADCLVKETDETEGDAKDEKNIRRRVYDALNVLIAVGVLQKNGKKVEAFKREENPIVEKMKKLKELSEKFLILKALVERNKNAKNCVQRLYLPFNVIVLGKRTEKTVKIVANFQKSNLDFKFEQDFAILHSDDLLKKVYVELDYSLLPNELNNLFWMQIFDNRILFYACFYVFFAFFLIFLVFKYFLFYDFYFLYFYIIFIIYILDFFRFLSIFLNFR